MCGPKLHHPLMQHCLDLQPEQAEFGGQQNMTEKQPTSFACVTVGSASS